MHVINYYNMQRKLIIINKEATIYGFLFISNCATIYRTPLLNTLIFDETILLILYIFDYKYYLSNSSKIDGTVI